MKFVAVSVVISLIFSPLASVMAFLITYGEYSHHYPDKRKPIKLATEAALVTLVFFIVLSFVIGFLLENIIGPQSL
jgi:uncharacterized BrkB/YihY/UPF0761 family membrane protein